MELDMNNKYELDDNVYFLNFETNKELAVNLLNFLPNKSFKDFCCCGKIIGMHITKEFEIFQYDIQIYDCYLNPSSEFKNIPEYLIKKEEKDLEDEFKSMIKQTLESISDYFKISENE